MSTTPDQTAPFRTDDEGRLWNGETRLTAEPLIIASVAHVIWLMNYAHAHGFSAGKVAGAEIIARIGARP